MPTSTQRQIKKAQNKLKNGENAAAREICEQIINKYPDNQRAKTLLGQIITQLDQVDSEPSQVEMNFLKQMFHKKQYLACHGTTLKSFGIVPWW